MTAEQIIRLCVKEFGGRLAVASGLSEEDQVIVNMIAKVSADIEVFTIDTGRLFQETLGLLAKNQKRYPLTFKVYYPDNEALEDMVRNHGINLFYESVANRRLCCGVRIVEPLKRALKDTDAWICGLRRAQSLTRKSLEIFELDEANEKIKISPLARWELKDVRRYIRKNKVDVNPLRKKGFLSIGCACCTRAVKKGEEIRAGRWWWEENKNKESGMHYSA
ncbi:MAG: phosphoadenylyl-sulfate reductase [Candidatus Omnitrophica bacterium]|nr:phosphoadenylyl-sulfate reductase [Candidatus Omnitrophota bacterium]